MYANIEPNINRIPVLPHRVVISFLQPSSGPGQFTREGAGNQLSLEISHWIRPAAVSARVYEGISARYGGTTDCQIGSAAQLSCAFTAVSRVLRVSECQWWCVVVAALIAELLVDVLLTNL